MSDEEKISILSQLPIKELDDLRLMWSTCYMVCSSETLDTCRKWADWLNAASEAKQANILKGLDEIEPTFI